MSQEILPNSQTNARPQATGRSRSYIEKLASDIARKLGYQAGDNLEEVVEKLGGEVISRSWKEAPADGSIHVFGEGRFHIFLSPYTGPLRDRFTIAHELGHYFLHSLAGKKPITINREGSDLTEWEANWFAAGFLMPEDEFKKKWSELGERVEAMAYHFNVSTQTVKIRKKVLGL